MTFTPEKFAQGMTPQQYLSQLVQFKEPIIRVYRSVELPPGDCQFFRSLYQPLRLAVFSAEWCGDALTTMPVVLRLSEEATTMETRVFDRDVELELTNSFLPPHRQGTVPVFVLFDQQMQPVAKFIETAPELSPLVARMHQQVAQEVLPPEERGKSLGELAEPHRSAFRARRTDYRLSMALEWGKVVSQAFTATLKEGLALPLHQRPAVGGTE